MITGGFFVLQDVLVAAFGSILGVLLVIGFSIKLGYPRMISYFGRIDREYEKKAEIFRKEILSTTEEAIRRLWRETVQMNVSVEKGQLIIMMSNEAPSLRVTRAGAVFLLKGDHEVVQVIFTDFRAVDAANEEESHNGLSHGWSVHPRSDDQVEEIDILGNWQPSQAYKLPVKS